jgi:hypothetical protein
MAAPLQKWIRTRARQGGMPKPAAVQLVSALKGTGIDELLVRLHREVGPSGDVWVVRNAPAPCHHPEQSPCSLVPFLGGK